MEKKITSTAVRPAAGATPARLWKSLLLGLNKICFCDSAPIFASPPPLQQYSGARIHNFPPICPSYSQVWVVEMDLNVKP